MPGRVREFNAIQAAGIAAALGMTVPQGWGWPVNLTVNVPPAGAPPAPAVAFADHAARRRTDHLPPVPADQCGRIEVLFRLRKRPLSRA